MKYTWFLILIHLVQLIDFELVGQENTMIKNSSTHDRKISIGINSGMSWAYEDRASLWGPQASVTIDYKIYNNIFVQFAPKYTWLMKWNEHYLTLPIHLRKKFGDKFSLYAGPALTFDLGYFKDLGLSAGAYYHINNRHAIVLSAYTFTLYDYFIDYLYVPVSLSYNICF